MLDKECKKKIKAIAKKEQKKHLEIYVVHLESATSTREDREDFSLEW